MFKKIINLVVILSFCFGNGDRWSELDGNHYSKNELIIMIKAEIAPKLGIEEPLNLQNRNELFSELSKYGTIQTFEPLFRFYNNFSDIERDNGLHQFYIISFIELNNVKVALSSLKNLSDIESINLNYRAEAFTVPNDPYYSLQWGHDNTGQAISYGGGNVGTLDSDTNTDLAWDITEGSEDIIISIIDTGVNGNHEEFAGKMVAGYDFVNNDSDASDGNMHGTACAGIAAAQGNNGVGIAGVAWNCKIMPVKVLSDDGYGDYADIANGIQFSAQEGANVISMSLGGGGFDNSMNYAINYANDVNCVVLSASGNDNNSTISYPSAYDGSMSIGS